MSELNQNDLGDPSTWDEDDPRPWRKHASTLEQELRTTREAQAEKDAKLAEYERRDAFAGALLEAQVTGISLDDLKDVPTEQINATFLKVRAQEKAAQDDAALEAQAKAAGFEDVASFKAALQAVDAKTAEERQALAAQGAVATAGGAGPAPQETVQERAWKAYKDARADGQPETIARAAYAKVLSETHQATTSA